MLDRLPRATPRYCALAHETSSLTVSIICKPANLWRPVCSCTPGCGNPALNSRRQVHGKCSGQRALAPPIYVSALLGLRQRRRRRHAAVGQQLSVMGMKGAWGVCRSQLGFHRTDGTGGSCNLHRSREPVSARSVRGSLAGRGGLMFQRRLGSNRSSHARRDAVLQPMHYS